MALNLDGFSFEESNEILIKKTGKDFNFFYTKYHDKLLFFIRKICQDSQKSEDICMDSFLTSLKKIEQYNEKWQFSTWLFTIAKNLSLQEVDMDKKSISMDSNIDSEGTTMKDFIQSEDIITTHADDLITLKYKIMIEKIENLKSPYREVIKMRELDGMSYEDIASKLKINLSTLKSRIKNGREILMTETMREFSIIDNMYPETFSLKKRRNSVEENIIQNKRRVNSKNLVEYDL